MLFHFSEPYHLQKTLECGQLFRFYPISNQSYALPYIDRILIVNQHNTDILKITSENTNGLYDHFRRLFRMHDDYNAILKSIRINPLMEKIIGYGNGLHLLLQDRFECACSFIMSQCSNIPRITHNLNALSEKYGAKIGNYYLFPTRDQLLKASVDDFVNLKFGYRAKYLYNFIHNVPDWFYTDEFHGEELNKKLKSIQGIGQKVSDCIQLFGFGDLSYFPVDTWISKFMIKEFNGGIEIPVKQIRKLGEELFGKYAGYAQEFIYYYARLNP